MEPNIWRRKGFLCRMYSCFTRNSRLVVTRLFAVIRRERKGFQRLVFSSNLQTSYRSSRGFFFSKFTKLTTGVPEASFPANLQN
jgi:hypothetical protein